MNVLSLLIGLIIGLVFGSYNGKLIVQYIFNKGKSPLTPTEEVSEYEIMKEFEKLDEDQPSKLTHDK